MQALMYTDGIHLISSESLAELHDFALNRLGLHPGWFHRSARHPHYDLLTEDAKKAAYAAGVMHCSSKDLVRILYQAGLVRAR